MDADVLLRWAANDGKDNDSFRKDRINDQEIWDQLYNKQTLNSVKQQIDQKVNANVADIIKGLKSLGHDDGNQDLSINSSPEHTDLLKAQAQAKSKIAALNEIWTIRSGFQESKSCIELGEYSSAFASLANLEQRVERWAGSHPGTTLAKQFTGEVKTLSESATLKFQQAWDNAIVFTELEEHTAILMISEQVDGVHLTDLYDTLQILDADLYYNNKRKVKFLHLLDRKIITPTLHMKVTSAEVLDNELTIKFKETATANNQEEVLLENVVSILTTIVDYLHRMLAGSQLHIDVYQQFSTKIMNAMVRTILPSYFPDSPVDLADYKTRLNCAKTFEDHLIEIGWIKSGEIDSWLTRLDDEWIAHRKTYYLDLVRVNIGAKVSRLITIDAQIPVPIQTEPEPKLEPVEQSQPKRQTQKQEKEQDTVSDEWGWNDDDEDLDEELNEALSGHKDNNVDDNGDDSEEGWGWGDDEPEKPQEKGKEATITTSGQNSGQAVKSAATNGSGNGSEPTFMGKKTITLAIDWLLDVASQFLFEIEDAGKADSRGQISDIINLYRVLALRAYENVPSPMIMYNDLLFLHERLEQNIFHDIISGDLILLKRQAQSVLNQVLNSIMQEIDKCLDSAKGFYDCAKCRNAKLCNNAVTDCVELISKEFGTWQQYLPVFQVNDLTAPLIEKAISRIIEDVEAIEDIAEDESVELADCLQKFSKLELLFPSDDPEITSTIASYVPSWIKFQYFIEIIQSSLADIKYLYHENSLIDFEKAELVNLIDALFATSENRERLKREILGS